MALTPEDGTGLATADSLISLADADTYFTAHGSPTAWTGLADAAKESALRYASRWLSNRYLWLGWIVQNDADAPQALAWPRAGIYDREGRIVPDDAVPTVVEEAVCEAALAHVSDVLNEIRDRGGDIAAFKAGPIEVSYFDGATAGRTFPYIDNLLAGLFIGITETGALSASPYIFPAP